MSTSIHLSSVGGFGCIKLYPSVLATVGVWGGRVTRGNKDGLGLTVVAEVEGIGSGDGGWTCVSVGKGEGSAVSVGTSVGGRMPANVMGVARGGLNGLSRTCGFSKMMRYQTMVTPIKTETIAMRNSNSASE